MPSTRPGEPVTDACIRNNSAEIENITDFHKAPNLLRTNPCQTLDRCLLLFSDQIQDLPEENQQNALDALVLLAQGQVSKSDILQFVISLDESGLKRLEDLREEAVRKGVIDIGSAERLFINVAGDEVSSMSRWELDFYWDAYPKKAKQVVHLVQRCDLGRIRELLKDEYDLPQLASGDLVKARNHRFNVNRGNKRQAKWKPNRNMRQAKREEKRKKWRAEWEQKCLSPSYWSVFDYINQGRVNNIWTDNEWWQMQIPLVLRLYGISLGNKEGGKGEGRKWDSVPGTLARRL